MNKINEFLNNDLKDLFIKLDSEMYKETAHLSSTDQIMRTNSFKSILDKGDLMMPFIIDRILDNSLKTSYFLLCQLISGGIPIKNENQGIRSLMRNDIEDWWNKNKSKYGR